MLEALGMDGETEAVYAALVASRPVSARELAAVLDAAVGPTRAALERLQVAGLVARQATRPITYRAIDPDVALDGLLISHQEQLHLAKLRAAEFAALFREAAANRLPAEVVEVVTGAEAVMRRSEQALGGAQHQVRVFDKPPYHGSRPLRTNPLEFELLARGCTARAIYSRAAIEIPGRLDVIKTWVDAGEQARVLPELPTKMALIDDRIAILPMRSGAGPDPSPSFMYLHRSGVLEALSALFETLWLEARPIVGDGAESDAALTVEDQLLVRLLTTGLPDEAIARQIKVSYRTLQRRIQALMRRAHAETRFQLGMYAAEHGWLMSRQPDALSG